LIYKKPFAYIDFADDAALLAEMLSVLVLVLALEVMETEAQPLGMSIIWTTTKIKDWVVVMPTCQCPRERSGGR